MMLRRDLKWHAEGAEGGRIESFGRGTQRSRQELEEQSKEEHAEE